MANFITKAAVALICAIPVVSYGNYTVTPVKVNIKPNSTMASLTIDNNNTEDRHFQVRIYQGDQKNTAPSAEETKDLVASPATFKIGGKKKQVIRIAVKNHDAAFQNKYYVLSVKELPHGKAEANTVKMVTDFRVPVIVGEMPVTDETASKKEDAKQ